MDQFKELVNVHQSCSPRKSDAKKGDSRLCHQISGFAPWGFFQDLKGQYRGLNELFDADKLAETKRTERELKER